MSFIQFFLLLFLEAIGFGYFPLMINCELYADTCRTPDIYFVKSPALAPPKVLIDVDEQARYATESTLLIYFLPLLPLSQ